MSAAPIFYLIFANTDENRILRLSQEEDAIRNLLRHAEKEERIKVVPQSTATIKKVGDFLIENPNQITVFHYGGHANSRQLLFTDQPARAEGLAKQLGQQKHLKLVFLNGCSTEKQVGLLLKNGIPAVIATSKSIGDKLAKAFAEYFYKAIAEDYTLAAAFNAAANLIKTKSAIYPRMYRNAEEREEASGELWGLHTDNNNVILHQKLIPAKMEKEAKTPTNANNTIGDGNFVFQGISATQGNVNITVNQNREPKD